MHGTHGQLQLGGAGVTGANVVTGACVPGAASSPSQSGHHGLHVLK